MSLERPAENQHTYSYIARRRRKITVHTSILRLFYARILAKTAQNRELSVKGPTKRFIKEGPIKKNEIIRDQIAGYKFPYVKGIVRKPIRNIEEVFRNARINVTSTYNIYFIGKSIYANLASWRM